MTCRSLPAALFPKGAFLHVAGLSWDQNTDTFITRQVGCRGAGDVLVGVCVSQPVLG